MSASEVTPRRVVGDAAARAIELKARRDADKKLFEPPKASDASWMAQWHASAQREIYTAQWNKRTARNERKAFEEFKAMKAERGAPLNP